MTLNTYCKNTWCPGCPNFGILEAFKKAVEELNKEEKIPFCNFVVLSGIGCHGKIVDYLNLNSFYALHGRAIATAQGIKLANSKLKVVVFVGDGDCYNEGICHLVHAAKRNSDITVIVHNNRTFALTVSQFTATSPLGFKGTTTPFGSPEEPFNPLKLVFVSNGTFIARGYAQRIQHLKNLIKEAIKHKGFSFVDVLQPCISFFDLRDFYNQKVYELENKNLDSPKDALSKIEEWNYQDGTEKIPIGIFYKIERAVFEEII